MTPDESSRDLRLVFQPVPAQHHDGAFASAFATICEGSASLSIASPYLSAEVVGGLTQGKTFRLVTDVEACFEARFDPGLDKFLTSNIECIRNLTGLHAKVVLGASAGLFGSANLTVHGLCHRYEMACVVRGAPYQELCEWFDALWRTATPVDPIDLDRHRNAMRAEQARLAVPAKSHSPLPRTGSLEWLKGAGRTARPLASRQDIVESGGEVAVEELTMLVRRLREITEDASSAASVLKMLALALQHAALPVEDERLHLNCHRPRYISITVGQRHVAWCRATKGRATNGRSEFGLMLQSFELVTRVVESVPGARQDAYTQDKVPVAPELYVPLRALDSLDTAVLDDWRRAIQRQAAQSRRSSFLKAKRAALYHILMSAELRAEAVRLAHR